jgi:pimeloyl-ACP methyl ester carboxylesterase
MSQIIKLSPTYTVSYRQIPSIPDPSKPTLVLLHCFVTTLDQFEPQFSDAKLLNTCNLLAIDGIGHGRTITAFDYTGQWNYRTNAQMVIDLIQKLSISKPIYILGVSQGGFIGARMALLNPDIVQGLILISSSMYADTEQTEKMGCPNIRKILDPWLKLLSDNDHDRNIHFQVPSSFTDALMKSLLGDHVPPQTREFWLKVCILNIDRIQTYSTAPTNSF